jgi:hypothetical protein
MRKGNDMRTWRLSLVGTVIVVLLGGLSVGVVAQEDDAEEVSTGLSPVTGTIIEGEQHGLYSTSYDADRIRRRGAVYEDPIEMDDARLSGTLWQTWSRDELPDSSGDFVGRNGELITGTTEITNDAGSWVGKMRGYIDPVTNQYHFQIDLTGTGAYEGYSALLYAKGPSTWDVEGLVFPGTLPDYPDPVVVPK